MGNATGDRIRPQLIRNRAEDRFWSRVHFASNGCWLWTGATDAYGYGRFKVDNRHVYVHRFSFEIHVGPIPQSAPRDGRRLVIDHACHNEDVACAQGRDCLHRRCVNPNHLRLCTDAQNFKAGRSGGRPRKAYCHRGHRLEGDNLYVSPKGARSCRMCQRERERTRRDRQQPA